MFARSLVPTTLDAPILQVLEVLQGPTGRQTVADVARQTAMSVTAVEIALVRAREAHLVNVMDSGSDEVWYLAREVASA